MRYTTVLFDLDFTLFDSEYSEPTAFEYTLTQAGVPVTDDIIETYAAINKALWAAVEAGDLTPNDVKTKRFEQLVEQASLDADPLRMADDYVYGLGAFGELYPGAIDVLDEVDSIATLALITNGIGQVQRDRIGRLGLERYFDAIVISGEVGTAKPGGRIFDLCFDALGSPDRATTVIIGDSLSSDMQGGIDYGIGTIWFDKHRSPTPDKPIDHHINALSQIPGIVRGTAS